MAAGGVLLSWGRAPISRALISVTPGRVGPVHAAQAVGFQMAWAAAGVVVFPTFVTLLARTMVLEILGLCLIAASLLLLAVHERADRRRKSASCGGFGVSKL